MGRLSVISYVDIDVALLHVLAGCEGIGEFRRRWERTSGFSSIIRLWLWRAARASGAVMGGGRGVVIVVVKVEWRSGVAVVSGLREHYFGNAL